MLLYLFSGNVTENTAWMHAAAMLMAVDHFNERNPILIPELVDYHDCGGFKFVNVSMVDTGTSSHYALKSMLQAALKNGGRPPDAIVGPYNEIPTLELSVLATGMETPLVALRGFDRNLILPEKHPFYTQVNPDLNGEMEFAGDYLMFRGRTNYIAILHSSDDSVLQRVETLQRILKQHFGIEQIKAFGYQSVGKTYGGEDRGIREAVRKISQTGFRTILFITSTPHLDTPEIGQAAHDFELDQGGHFWVLAGGLEASAVDKEAILEKYQYSHIGDFLRGATYLYLMDTHLFTWNNTFDQTFFGQNATFVQRLRELNPVPNFFVENFYDVNFTGREDEVFPPDDIFQQFTYPLDYITFGYDAVMAIGIGACLATAHQNGTTMTGEQHLHGIHYVDFHGLSGQVKFGDIAPGSRVGSSVYNTIINLLPPGGDR